MLVPFSVDIVDTFVVLGLAVAAEVGCMADGLTGAVAGGTVSWERIIFEIASLRQQFAFCTGVTPE